MIAALILAAAYLGLAGVAFQRSTRRTSVETWLLVYCGYSVILMGLHALILSNQGGLLPMAPERLVRLVGLMISVSLTIGMTLAYFEYRKSPLWWMLPIGVWAGAVLITELSPISSATGATATILGAPATLGNGLALLGWLATALALLITGARAFLKEPLPLYANRILFWSFVTPVLLLGDALAGWLSTPWNYVGYGIRLVGAIGAVYGVLSYRVLNLREVAGWVINRAILTLITGVLVLAGILAVLYAPSPVPGPGSRLSIAVVIAVLAAVFLQPVYAFFSWLTRRLIAGGVADPAESVRLYGQQISGVIDLRELATVAIMTINQLMHTRRGNLILATPRQGEVALEVINHAQAAPANPVRISETSPIYRRFMQSQQPLLQYDIDYHQDFATAPPSELRYFNSLEMDIYAPIVDEGKLIGMLGLGPKVNDQPFTIQETQLLAALAHQTVVALENARLVSDLRGLNERFNTLNEELRTANERLERLDSVKTDFITIASHELRTPLTQIQGYTDLLAEMSEQGALTRELQSEMLGKLTKASQRMTEVVGAMLDVSQLDVEVLDLNFEEISLAGIIKQAIEPYADAIQERKLTLVAQGLRQLPPIYGDPKRLPQAFENLVTNAIKFTPDGGKITIIGQVLGHDVAGLPQSVQIFVTDTGIGIDRANQQLIFDKFYRVGPVELHSTSATKFKGAGTGLGLSLVKGIVEGHGGRIWVESEGYDEEKLCGSTFNVVLPIRPPTMDLSTRLRLLQEAGESAGVIPGSDPITGRPGQSS